MFYEVKLIVDAADSMHPASWDWADLVGPGTEVVSAEAIGGPVSTVLLAANNAGVKISVEDARVIASELTDLGARFDA